MRASRRLLVTFDFTGTLGYTYPPVGIQYAEACKNIGVKLEPELAQRAFMDAFRMAKKEWPNYGLGHLVSTKSWWGRVVQETIMRTMDMQAEKGETMERDKNLTKEVSDRVFDDLYARFGSNLSYRLFEDVKPALKRLRHENHRIAIISNSDERLSDILGSLGVLKKMEFILVSSEFGVRKPDPSIFREALRLAKCSGEDAVHVGDQELSDCAGALNAGFSTSFLIKRNNPEFSTGETTDLKSLSERRCFTVDSLSDLWNHPPFLQS